MKVGTLNEKLNLIQVLTAALSVGVLLTCLKSENDSLIAQVVSPKPLIKS